MEVTDGRVECRVKNAVIGAELSGGVFPFCESAPSFVQAAAEIAANRSAVLISHDRRDDDFDLAMPHRGKAHVPDGAFLFHARRLRLHLNSSLSQYSVQPAVEERQAMPLPDWSIVLPMHGARRAPYLKHIHEIGVKVECK